MSELPLFPLSVVLMPSGRLPLQIFEPRYLDLVSDCMKSGTPFGLIWMRSGSEVAQRGQADPKLGDIGTCAHIVDWDQLSNGLLGITVEGGERFALHSTRTCKNGLVMGQVSALPSPSLAAMHSEWVRIADVLRSLEAHPHVESLGLRIDYNNAWQVANTLIQVLPMDEHLKYELLSLETIDDVMEELECLLSQMSGEL